MDKDKEKDKKKKKLDVKEVFNNDDEDDSNANTKKRKLVPLGKFLYCDTPSHFPILDGFNLKQSCDSRIYLMNYCIWYLSLKHVQALYHD